MALKFEVIDHDTLGSNDFLGSVIIPLSIDVGTLPDAGGAVRPVVLQSGWFALEGGGEGCLQLCAGFGDIACAPRVSPLADAKSEPIPKAVEPTQDPPPTEDPPPGDGGTGEFPPPTQTKDKAAANSTAAMTKTTASQEFTPESYPPPPNPPPDAGEAAAAATQEEWTPENHPPPLSSPDEWTTESYPPPPRQPSPRTPPPNPEPSSSSDSTNTVNWTLRSHPPPPRSAMMILQQASALPAHSPEKQRLQKMAMQQMALEMAPPAAVAASAGKTASIADFGDDDAAASSGLMMTQSPKKNVPSRAAAMMQEAAALPAGSPLQMVAMKEVQVMMARSASVPSKAVVMMQEAAELPVGSPQREERQMLAMELMNAEVAAAEVERTPPPSPFPATPSLPITRRATLYVLLHFDLPSGGGGSSMKGAVVAFMGHGNGAVLTKTQFMSGVQDVAQKKELSLSGSEKDLAEWAFTTLASVVDGDQVVELEELVCFLAIVATHGDRGTLAIFRTLFDAYDIMNKRSLSEAEFHDLCSTMLPIAAALDPPCIPSSFRDAPTHERSATIAALSKRMFHEAVSSERVTQNVSTRWRVMNFATFVATISTEIFRGIFQRSLEDAEVCDFIRARSPEKASALLAAVNADEVRKSNLLLLISSQNAKSEKSESPIVRFQEAPQSSSGSAARQAEDIQRHKKTNADDGALDVAALWRAVGPTSAASRVQRKALTRDAQWEVAQRNILERVLRESSHLDTAERIARAVMACDMKLQEEAKHAGYPVVSERFPWEQPPSSIARTCAFLLSLSPLIAPCKGTSTLSY